METWKEELYHHGIKGMKWGVRRYQNADGSYTQAGLKRYGIAEENYHKRDAEYKSAKEAYKSGKGSKAEVNRTKHNRKTAKRELSDKYDQLKRDHLADQGKDLYANGKTITGNANVASTAATIGSVGATAAHLYYKNSGKVLLTKHGVIPMSTVAPAAIAAGSAAIGGALSAKNAYQNKRLKAYYGHSRREKKYDYR